MRPTNVEPVQIVSASKWISVLDEMPERNHIVLMYVPFCKQKVDVGLFNGINWKTTSGIKILNISFWAKINKENLPEFDLNDVEANQEQIKENYSLAKKTAIDFENWIMSSESQFEWADGTTWLFEGDYYTTEAMFDYYERNHLNKIKILKKNDQ